MVLFTISQPNQNTILINIKWYYFTRYGKKYNEIQLTKNKMDLNNRKMTNHQPSPETNNNDLLEKDGGTKNCIYKDL